MWNNSKQLPQNFAPIGESEYTAAPGVLFLHPGDGIFYFSAGASASSGKKAKRHSPFSSRYSDRPLGI